MKNIPVLGAAGRTGRYILRELNADDNLKITAFDIRLDAGLAKQYPKIRFVQGDVLDVGGLIGEMADQEIVVATLEGDVLPMAQSLIAACATARRVRRIIWLTGMGIHGEVKGIRKLFLDQYVRQYPDYIRAADAIAASKIPYTLLRCPNLYDGENAQYDLTTEARQPRNRNVERAAVARCIADMIRDEALGKNESLGITN